MGLFFCDAPGTMKLFLIFFNNINMKHSVMNRIIIGKTMGFVAGLLVFLLLPVLGVTLDLKFGLGLIVFYVVLGVLTAFMGTMDHHPIFKFPLPWWLRGLLMGLTMHVMLVLLAYDQIGAIAQSLNLFGMVSPWWALLDGAILGVLMAFVETKWAGEGKLPME